MRPTRTQHPGFSTHGRGRPSDPGADAVRPGPEAPTQLRGERVPARLPAPPGLPAVGSEGGGVVQPPPVSGRIPPTRQPLPLSGRRLPVSGRSPFSSGCRTSNLPPRSVPQVARRSKPLPKLLRKSRRRPPALAPALGMRGREWTAPHLRLIHTCSRGLRLRPGSAPRPPPAPAAVAAAGRRGREKAPGSGSAIPGAVLPSSGPGGTRGSPSLRPPLRSAGIWWGKQQPP